VPDPILVIACGALAREIQQLKLMNHWQHMKIQCIDAKLHFRPALIPERLKARIRDARGKYSRIFVAYADCGTGGMIDRVLEEEGGDIERLPGAHCYQFFAGGDVFDQLAEAEPGTFYLTDFLVRYFDRLVVRALKLDTHPELLGAFFGNYKRVVYLSQTRDGALLEKAKAAAGFLRLDFVHLHSGYGGLETGLRLQMETQASGG